jgi:hypothetical protein
VSIIFISPHRPDKALGPTTILPNGYGELIAPEGGGGIRRVREADHSPLTSDGVKETLVYSATTSYVLMSQCLIT